MPAFWTNCTEKATISNGPGIAPGCDFVLNTKAVHGDRYLCLKTRSNQIWDCIAQNLEGKQLSQDSSYRMSVLLAYSEEAASTKKNGKKGKSHQKAVILRVWGISYLDSYKELLAFTAPINHTEWRSYEMTIRPQESNYDALVFEAFYDFDRSFAYNGNLLLDNISPIVTITDTFEIKAGDFIALNNPSFEDTPRCCTPPDGWISCGPADESPTDIQPGFFNVWSPAADGKTYLGMVVRDNNTTEAVTQRLSKRLLNGHTYELKAALAHSKILTSFSRTTGEEVQYKTPVVLRIWGGERLCSKTELLAESPPISNIDWENYTFQFTPQTTRCNYLILEAYYSNLTTQSYNGNLLVDNLSLQLLKD